MQARRIRWNRLAILIFGVLGILLVCCVGIWAFAPNLRRIVQAPFWKTDSQLAAQAARQMFDYELPANYQEQQVLNIQGHDAAVIIAHREKSANLIFVERIQEGIIGVDAWRVRYEETLSREKGQRRYSTQTVGTQKLTVRDQPVTLRLFAGADENGREVRQAVCGFTGKSGDVLIAMVAGRDTWDEEMVNQFLRSIR